MLARTSATLTPVGATPAVAHVPTLRSTHVIWSLAASNGDRRNVAIAGITAEGKVAGRVHEFRMSVPVVRSAVVAEGA